MNHLGSPEGFEYALFSFIAYILFILYSFIFKTGKGDFPLWNFNKAHFDFVFVYFFVSIVYTAIYRNFNWSIFLFILLGVFYYFGIHYGLFQNFFGLAQRSISASILVLILENDSSMKKKEIMSKYANGKGFGHIKKSRLNDMENLNWIKQINGEYTLTKKGKTVALFVTKVLKLWNLKQMVFRK